MKTVLVLDAIEAVVVLNREQSAHLLHVSGFSNTASSSSVEGAISGKKGRKAKVSEHASESLSALSQYVVASAGESGVVHLHAVSLLGKDVNSFRCQPLCQISVAHSPPRDPHPNRCTNYGSYSKRTAHQQTACSTQESCKQH